MITYWNQFIATFKDILLASLFFAICAFLNASMDVTKDKFSSSVYSKISEPGTATYKYFESDWRNKWETWPDGGLILDKDGNKIPKWFLGIHIVPLNHPMFFDSWHLFKSAMVFFFGVTLIVLYFKAAKIIFKFNKWYYWVVLGIVLVWFFLDWNIVFNLFYDHWLMV
jgi:hypothetical protein